MIQVAPTAATSPAWATFAGKNVAGLCGPAVVGFSETTISQTTLVWFVLPTAQPSAELFGAFGWIKAKPQPYPGGGRSSEVRVGDWPGRVPNGRRDAVRR